MEDNIKGIFQISFIKVWFFFLEKIIEITKNIDETKGADARVNIPKLKKTSIFIFLIKFKNLFIKTYKNNYRVNLNYLESNMYIFNG